MLPGRHALNASLLMANISALSYFMMTDGYIEVRELCPYVCGVCTCVGVCLGVYLCVCASVGVYIHICMCAWCV